MSTPSRPAPRPVMADVARQAGVSHQTVSRVLNGHPNVSPGTRASVLAAIRDLGYRPNAAARIPLVAVGCGTRAPLPSVAIDNLSGAAQATRHLLDLGHETVHHIGGPDSWFDAQERVEGWRQTLRSAGAPEPELLRGDWSA